MKPSEAFGVVVRSVGLVTVLSATSVLFYALVNLALGGPTSVVGLLIVGVPPLLVGFWLLFGASDLASAVYPKEPPKGDDA
jgi:hypothetical protein